MRAYLAIRRSWRKGESCLLPVDPVLAFGQYTNTKRRAYLVGSIGVVSSLVVVQVDDARCQLSRCNVKCVHCVPRGELSFVSARRKM